MEIVDTATLEAQKKNLSAIRFEQEELEAKREEITKRLRVLGKEYNDLVWWLSSHTVSHGVESVASIQRTDNCQ